MMKRTETKRLYSLKEASIFLGRSTWSVRGMLWAGKMPQIKDGRRIFIDIRDMEKWIEQTKKTFGN
ncbi:MAG: helix-turn-helix domain-containing protein [Syntrophorhabdaceae bacterium]|nr:helix-turn-helix domain-containing protein [Syntrophorhabdaceae bacterium]